MKNIYTDDKIDTKVLFTAQLIILTSLENREKKIKNYIHLIFKEANNAYRGDAVMSGR